jgi:hypothetical protein
MEATQAFAHFALRRQTFKRKSQRAANGRETAICRITDLQRVRDIIGCYYGWHNTCLYYVWMGRTQPPAVGPCVLYYYIIFRKMIWATGHRWLILAVFVDLLR